MNFINYIYAFAVLCLITYEILFIVKKHNYKTKKNNIKKQKSDIKHPFFMKHFDKSKDYIQALWDEIK